MHSWCIFMQRILHLHIFYCGQTWSGCRRLTHLFTAGKMGTLHLTNNTEKSVLISRTGPDLCLGFNHSLLDCLSLEFVDPYQVWTFTRENICLMTCIQLKSVPCFFFCRKCLTLWPDPKGLFELLEDTKRKHEICTFSFWYIISLQNAMFHRPVHHFTAAL